MGQPLLDPPLVSIIIACRNAERTLPEALASACAQRYAQLEIIVVDDGSTDATAEIASQWPDVRILFLRQPPLGAQVARNRGLAAARGELIQFLDGDDLLDPAKIAVQVMRYRELGPRYVYMASYTRFRHTPGVRPAQPTAIWCDMDPAGWLAGSWSGGGMMPTHSWLVPRELLAENPGWDERLLQNQDGEFFSRVLLASDGVRHCPLALCHYREGQPGSTSRNRSRAARESLLLSACLSTLNLIWREDSERTRTACATLLMDVAARVSSDFPDLSRQALMRALQLHPAPRTNERGRLWHVLARLVGWNTVFALQPWVDKLRLPQQKAKYAPSLGAFQKTLAVTRRVKSLD